MLKFLLMFILITSSLFSETLIISPFKGLEYNDNISISEMFNEHLSKTIKTINSQLFDYNFGLLDMRDYNEIIMNDAKDSNADYVLFGYISRIHKINKLNIKVVNVKYGHCIYTYSWSFQYIEKIEPEIYRIHIYIIEKILNDSSIQF